MFTFRGNTTAQTTPNTPAAPAQNAPRSRFAGLNGAQAYATGSYFNAETEGPTECVCKVSDVMYKDTRKNGGAVIVELEVVETSNPNVPVGTKKSWVQTLKDRDIAWPNIIGFLAAICGLDVNNTAQLQIINSELSPKAEQLIEEACDQKKANGIKVKCSAFVHETKEKRKITRVRFSPSAQ